MKLLSYDSPLISKVNVLADAMLVNIVFLLCCVPVVTIGAARTALFSVGFRWNNKKDAGVKEFWKAFTKNLKSSILPWLIVLGCGLFLAYDLFVVLENKFPGSMIFLIFCGIALAILLLLQSQMFIFHAKYNCTLRQLFGNAALLVLAHPLRAIFVTVLSVLPLVLFLGALDKFFAALPLWVLLYYGLEGYLSAGAMRKVYERLENRGQEEDEAAEEIEEGSEG